MKMNLLDVLSGRRTWAGMLLVVALMGCGGIGGDGKERNGLPGEKTAQSVVVPSYAGYVVKANGGGKRKVVLLADGSQVLLNAQSLVRLAPGFGDGVRRLVAEGDVFFSVVPKERPMTIETAYLILTTKGGAFRVGARTGSSGSVVDVLSGEVVVQKRLVTDGDSVAEVLGGGDELMYNRDIDMKEKETADTAKLRLWLGDRLVWKHAGLTEVVNAVGDWFEVEVSVEGEPPAGAVMDGVFERAGLEEVMRAVAARLGGKYVPDGEKVVLRF